MDKQILYILPFRNGKYFKFGITKNMNLDRIKEVNRNYGIDVDRSLIYYGDTREVTSIESKLKDRPCLEQHKYKGCDGYTEVRKISELDDVINIVKTYNLSEFELKSLNFKFKRYRLSHLPKKKKINHIKRELSSGPVYLPEVDLTPISIPDNYPHTICESIEMETQQWKYGK